MVAFPYKFGKSNVKTQKNENTKNDKAYFVNEQFMQPQFYPFESTVDIWTKKENKTIHCSPT